MDAYQEVAPCNHFGEASDCNLVSLNMDKTRESMVVMREKFEQSQSSGERSLVLSENKQVHLLDMTIPKSTSQSFDEPWLRLNFPNNNCLFRDQFRVITLVTEDPDSTSLNVGSVTVRMVRYNYKSIQAGDKVRKCVYNEDSTLDKIHVYFIVKFILSHPPKAWLQEVKALMKGGRGFVEEDPELCVVWGDSQQVKKVAELPYVLEVWQHALKDSSVSKTGENHSTNWKGLAILFSMGRYTRI